MQMFVRCPFCGRVFDMLEERSVSVMIDGTARTAHQACAMRLGPPETARPNGEPKSNGALNLKPGELENA